GVARGVEVGPGGGGGVGGAEDGGQGAGGRRSGRGRAGARQAGGGCCPPACRELGAAVGDEPGEHPGRRERREGGQDRPAGGLPAGHGGDGQRVTAEQHGGGQGGPGGTARATAPAAVVLGASGGRGAEEQVESAGGRHGRRPGGCVLQGEVVGPHGRGERRGHGEGGASRTGGQGQTRPGERTRGGEGGGRADAAGRDRAMRPLPGVLLAVRPVVQRHARLVQAHGGADGEQCPHPGPRTGRRDRKSTRLNSSHVKISYAVFCLKKKK